MRKEVKNKEEKKELGFITVINFIVGILLCLFGIMILIMAYYTLGILLIVLAIFLFLPQRVLRFSKWLKLLIAVIGFIVIAIIGGMQMPSAEKEVINVGLNEPFIVLYNENNFSMIIYNTTTEKTISINGQEKTSEGIYLLVNGAVTSLAKEASDFGFNVKLEDNQGNSYTVVAYNLGEGQLQPNLKRNFFDVFEIPKTASGLKLHVEDSSKLVRIVDLEI